MHVIGPTVNAANPVGTKTVDGPFGPITLTARFVQDEGIAGVSAMALGSGTCVSSFNQPSYRFTISTPWVELHT